MWLLEGAEKIVVLKGRGFSRVIDTSFVVRLQQPRESLGALLEFFSSLFCRAA
jgi:hypothetical protein